MTSNSLRIAITGTDPTAINLPDAWVRLEQELPSVLSQFASIRDVYQLWLAAATGRSAQKLRAINCPVEFVGADTHVYLGFYAWPSDPALNYSLSSAIGTLGSGQIIRKQREFSLFVNNRSRADMPCYLEDVTVEWETPTFNRYGDRIPAPTITNHNTWLEFSVEVFGAMRITGTAVGAYLVCEMVLTRPITQQAATPAVIAAAQIGPNGELIYTPPSTVQLNGYKISNLENTITAAWLNPSGETDTDQLRLEIPQCVKDVLEFCPDMYKTILLWCDKTATREVYYNSCTGDLIGVWDGVDEQSYCSSTEVGSSFDPGRLI